LKRDAANIGSDALARVASLMQKLKPKADL
jgi:hypothetical protein